MTTDALERLHPFVRSSSSSGLSTHYSGETGAGAPDGGGDLHLGSTVGETAMRLLGFEDRCSGGAVLRAEIQVAGPNMSSGVGGASSAVAGSQTTGGSAR